MRKAFDPTNGSWQVEFSLPPEVGSEQAWVVGEWDGWDQQANPLVAQDGGRLVATVTLEPGRRYRFRYYLGDGRWENDWQADDYVDNDHGGADSVVELEPAPPTDAAPAADGAAAPKKRRGKAAAADKPAADDAAPPKARSRLRKRAAEGAEA